MTTPLPIEIYCMLQVTPFRIKDSTLFLQCFVYIQPHTRQPITQENRNKLHFLLYFLVWNRPWTIPFLEIPVAELADDSVLFIVARNLHRCTRSGRFSTFFLLMLILCPIWGVDTERNTWRLSGRTSLTLCMCVFLLRNGTTSPIGFPVLYKLSYPHIKTSRGMVLCGLFFGRAIYRAFSRFCSSPISSVSKTSLHWFKNKVSWIPLFLPNYTGQ